MLVRRIARPLLSAAFIGQGVETLRNPKPAAHAAQPSIDGLQKLPDPVGSNVPTDPITFARITAGVQIGGGVLLATGKFPRLASAALAFTVVPGNLGAHMFWTEVDPERKAEARRGFLTDLSLLGGLIIASADTAGKPSLGWRGRRAARKLGDRVSSSLPSGSSSGTLTDSVLAEKIGHGLALGAERSRELAHVAGERTTELAEAAKPRVAALAEAAKERSADWAEVAKDRGADLAEVAKDRGSDLADVAKHRSVDLADLTKARGAELAYEARLRGLELADTTNAKAKRWRW
ncbi:MAG: DoxX family protein [Mycobacterium sp.]